MSNDGRTNVSGEAIAKLGGLLVFVGFIAYAISGFLDAPPPGSATIEKCGNTFRYYDRNFMIRHRYDGCISRNGTYSGFTISYTDPAKTSDFVDESETLCGIQLRVISTGRKIPTNEVEYKPYFLGNASGNVLCESYTFKIPSKNISE